MEMVIGLLLLTGILVIALLGPRLLEDEALRRRFYREYLTGNWFTLDDLVNRGYPRDNTMGLLQAAKMFGFIENDPYEFIAGSDAHYDSKFIHLYRFRMTEKGAKYARHRLAL